MSLLSHFSGVKKSLWELLLGYFGGDPESHFLAWWTFRIFFIYFLLGEGEGGVEAPEGGGGSAFLLKSPGGGVSRTGGAEGPGVFAANWRIFAGGGGGA